MFLSLHLRFSVSKLTNIYKICIKKLVFSKIWFVNLFKNLTMLTLYSS